jgi:preprotein translocase subunit SecD
MSRKKTIRMFWLIIGLTLICLLINFPKKLPLKIHIGSFNWEQTLYRPEFNIGKFTLNKNVDLKYGLDLAGGSSLLFDIDISKVPSDGLSSALESLKSNIERRINLFGVSETSVQINKQQDKYRLQVDLPGVENVNDAINLIGNTAQLNFYGVTDEKSFFEATNSAQLNNFLKDTTITGSNLANSSVTINSNNSEPEVSIQFDQNGAKLFEEATKEFLGKKIAIFLDGQLLMAPTVKTVITEGKASISGGFDTKSAKELSVQLNAGALPLPISLIHPSTVGATLGQDSLNKGIFAGIIGLILVTLFMIGNYGKVGLIADIGLIIYALITLTLYRLIPITLTFPGIVGFILSIGMAVDSNILIFERLKEETRAGKDWNVALETAFGRAWDSIKDANTCTVITGFILFNPFNWSFLSTSGMIRGFAVTLILGIFIGIFTGVFVTRNLLRVFAKQKLPVKSKH